MKGNVVDREKFTQMLSEYYELRGWDSSGLQTKQQLAELDLNHKQAGSSPAISKNLLYGGKNELSRLSSLLLE